MIKGKLLVGCLFLGLFFRPEGKSLLIRTKKRFPKPVVLKHFWKNTGFSPPSDGPNSTTRFLLSEDEELNLDYIGALPNGGIEAVRIHWILDLVTVTEDLSGNPVFHLENLDRLIDRLYRNNLRPVFELMGNPSNFFRNFRNQSHHWTGMLREIASHYRDIYGEDYVRGWRFELMNEPDLKQYNPYNFTLEEYIDYFKASETALPGLAGPAGLFRPNKKAHPLCWGFLDYCNLHPCTLNVITFHRKGDQFGSQVVSEGLRLINTLISDYPNLKGVPFGNDEADILVGWYKPMEWRADVRYAALVVQVIIGHIEEMLVRRNIPFEMLSNDNAFLSFSPHYFTQRTLLARFQMNNTNPTHVQFFRKPVYSVMALLSLSGHHLTDVRYHPGTNGYSYLATYYKYHSTFLGVITDDRAANETYCPGNATRMEIRFRIGLEDSAQRGVCVGYLMDNNHSSPYQVWRDGGSPDFPDSGLRRRMREAEGFKRLFIRRLKPHLNQLKFTLTNVLLPSVWAVHVCYQTIEPPGRVIQLQYRNVTENEIILFWKNGRGENRCVKTYTVEFRGVEDEDFKRINDVDSIFLSYHHDGVGKDGVFIGIAGQYRVAAIDYWNRRGPYSQILTLPPPTGTN